MPPTRREDGAGGLAPRSPKILSVNNVDRQWHLAERDDGSGEVVERDEAVFELFITHEQFAEPVEPAMADRHHPAPRLLCGVASLGIAFLPTIDQVGNVAVFLHDVQSLTPATAGIGTQVFATPQGWRLALDYSGFKDRFELGDVIDVRCGHDERQRDATAVHEQVALAAFFSPDRSGSARPLLAPRAL